MWKKEQHEEQAQSRPAPAPPRQRAEPVRERSGSAARIGPQSRFEGEVGGSEDLVVEGSLEGKVRLEQCVVTVGASGQIKGDVFAKRIVVEGTVHGNLHAGDEIVVTESGVVEGNLHTPRITLRDGCRFQGSIDMGKGEKKSAPEKARSEPKAEESTGGAAAERAASERAEHSRQPVAANA